MRPRKKRRITQERKKKKECRVLCSQKRREMCKITNSQRFLWKKVFTKKIVCCVMCNKGKIPLISLANLCCPSKIPYPSLPLPSSSKLLPQPPTPIIRGEPRKKTHPSSSIQVQQQQRGFVRMGWHIQPQWDFSKLFLWLFFAKRVMMDLLARLQGSPPFAWAQGILTRGR